MQGIQNYVSVTEQLEDARIEIDRCKEKGIVRDISRGDAAYRFGCGTVSKLALIITTKADLTVKRRVVIDLRRSRGNERSVVNERLILPRISGVLRALKKMRSLEHKLGESYEAAGSRDAIETEIYLVDFADAFCHFAVHRQELRHCLSPGLQANGSYGWHSCSASRALRS